MRKLELLDVWAARKMARQDVRDEVAQYVAGLGVERDKPLRVLVCIGDAGTAVWRVFTPFLELAKDGRFEPRITNGVDEADIEWCDVLWLQRTVLPEIVHVIERAHTLGKRIVFEIDDWVHGVPDYNPAFHKVIEERQPAVIEQILRLADVSVFATERVAELYRAIVGGRVAVLENAVDPDTRTSPALSPFGARDTVNIGWAGAPNHYADLKLIEPALVEVMRRHPEVWFIRMGCFGGDLRPTKDGFVQDDAQAELPQDRVVRLMWDNSQHTLGKYLPLIDIGLAPLVDNQFNSGKSDVKILDHAMFWTPVVASRLTPYAQHDGHAVLVDNTTEAWVAGIESLLDVSARKAMGAKAFAYATQNRTIATNAHKWAELLEGFR